MATVDELLAAARSRLDRLSPVAAAAAAERGAVLVDIRPDGQRQRDGSIPGAIEICRNVLEWRADPAGADRDPRVADPRQAVIVVCDQGYQSSLAAATLQTLGLPLATDVMGGVVAWRAAGLPLLQANPRR